LLFMVIAVYVLVPIVSGYRRSRSMVGNDD
jgi:hypothetical protein